MATRLRVATYTVLALTASALVTYALALRYPPTLTMTPWDHAVMLLEFAVADAAIAYVFVKHVNPRLVVGKVHALMDHQREDLLRELLAALRPSPEQQAQAEAMLQERLKAAVQEGAQGALSGNMKALSARGVDARTSFAALEEEFLQAVLAHDKGGPVAAAFAEWLSGNSPKVYKVAVRLGADGAAKFLEKNAERIQGWAAKIGIGDAPKKQVVVV